MLEANRPTPEPEIWPARVLCFNALDEDWRSPRLGHLLGHWGTKDKNDERYPTETFDDAVDRFVVHLLALLGKTPTAGDSVAPPGPTAVPAWHSSRSEETLAENKPTSPPRTVAFLLSHMYRKRSIRPEYLKGVDAAIYHALAASKQLRVILHHVTFEVAQIVWYSIDRQRLAICPPYDTGVSPQEIAEPVLVLSRPGSDATYLATEQDGRVAHGELYVGNEALEQPSWYVAGAMFVSLL